MPTPQSSPTIQERVGKTLLLLALVSAVLAGCRWMVEDAFLKEATTAQGKVVWVDSKKQNAKVLFQDARGNEHEVKPQVRSSFRSYAVGETIVVLFDPSKPEQAKFNEPMQLWASTHMCLYLAAISGVIGWLTARGRLVWAPLRTKRIWVG